MSEVLAISARSSGYGRVDSRPLLARPSEGASDDAKRIGISLKEIESRQISLGAGIAPRTAASLDERLYDALALAKVSTSQVAMHLERDWRDRLFAQLDDMLGAAEWHEDDEPLLEASFTTFLRLILYQKPARRPGLGLSHRGHLIAAWTTGRDRLTLECLPNDSVLWVLSCLIDGDRESAAGQTHVVRLPEVLAPYRPERWFAHAYQATR
jgi:hypothetical protein